MVRKVRARQEVLGSNLIHARIFHMKNRVTCGPLPEFKIFFWPKCFSTGWKHHPILKGPFITGSCNRCWYFSSSIIMFARCNLNRIIYPVGVNMTTRHVRIPSSHTRQPFIQSDQRIWRTRVTRTRVRTPYGNPLHYVPTNSHVE
jgi:hypothetical protein